MLLTVHIKKSKKTSIDGEMHYVHESAHSTLITVRIFVGIDKLILKFKWKGKGVKITKSILKKNEAGGISLLDFKTWLP